jgi:tetratricopeptide (TPR) repeat protein
MLTRTSFLAVALTLASLLGLQHALCAEETKPGAAKLTKAGEASLANAEKAYDDGDKQKAAEELAKAKDCFQQAIKANAKYVKAYYDLGASYMLEAEKGGCSPNALSEALGQADKWFDDAMQISGMRYLPAMVDRCKIWDKFYPHPDHVRTIAQLGIDYYNEHPLDPTKPDYAKNREYLVQLHFYLAKSTRIIAMSNLVSLLYDIGATLPEQDRKFRYAQTALDLQKAAAEYQTLVDAIGHATLPEDVTPAQLYVSLGEIQLHLLECYWPIYMDADGKEMKPPVDFSQLDEDKANQRKEVFFTLGLLVDKDANVFKPFASLRQEIAAKTTNTTPNTPVDPKTTNYFDLARQAAEDAVKNAAAADADKAKSELEDVLLEIGGNLCLYGVIPPDQPPAVRPGETYLDEIRKDPSVSKTGKFYIHYAELLAGLGKIDKAAEVLTEGAASLKSPGMYLALGRLYADTGRFSEAREQFAAVLTADPENKDAHYELANLDVTSAEQGHKEYLKDAAEHVQWLIKNNPDDLQYLLLEGRMRMQTPGEADKARDIFQRVYNMSGVAHVQGAYWLGLYYSVQNDPDRAMRYLTEAKELLGPNANLGVYYSLVSILMGRNTEKALALCKEYEKYAKEQRRPMEDEMLRSMAQCQAMLGLKDEAAKTYDELIKRGKISAGVDKGYMLLGGFTNATYIGQAEQMFKEVIDAEKDLPSLRKSLGAYYGLVQCIFMQDKNNTKAALQVLEGEEWMKPIIDDIEKIMSSGTADEKLDAKNKIRHYLAELYDVYERETPRNMKMLHDIVGQMISIDPNNPETLDRQYREAAAGLPPTDVAKVTEEQTKLVNEKLADPKIDEQGKQAIRRDFAQRLFAAERFDDAKKWFLEVLKIEPNDFTANHRLAEICIGKGEYDEAEKYAKVLEAASPDNQQVKVLRALLDSTRAGNIDDRITILEKAVKDNPDIALMHFMLAQAYKDAARSGKGDQAGNLEKALKEYYIVFKMSGMPVGLAGEIAQAHLNLGRIYMNAGDANKAKEHYEQCRGITESLCETLPDNADFLRMLAECKAILAKNNDDINAAIVLYEKAKDIKLQQLKDAEANKKSETIKALNADLFSIYNDLVPLLQKVGQTERAKQYSEEMQKYASE